MESSLLGAFALWSLYTLWSPCHLELSFSGALALWSRYYLKLSLSGVVAMELPLSGADTPWSHHSMEPSLSGVVTLLTRHSPEALLSGIFLPGAFALWSPCSLESWHSGAYAP